MKATANKILLIILMVVITGIVAVAEVSRDRIVSVDTVYKHPSYEPFITSCPMYPEPNTDVFIPLY